MIPQGHIDAKSTGGMTLYTITGDREYIEWAIEDIKFHYHPLGYSTHFSPPKQNEAGDWVAYGSRANSCD